MKAADMVAKASKDLKPAATEEPAVTTSDGGTANASTTAQSSPEDTNLEKTEVESNPTNESLKQEREASPSGKKRALLDPAIKHEPINKKSKVSPPPPSKEASLATEESSNVPDEVEAVVDKEKWQGFCEIESEPAYFSVILREIGVEGITVREVPFMDEDTLSTLPNPIYGLILLFRHRQFDLDSQEETCPSDVWFANQMPGQNSCATLAMIHALLNMAPTEGIEIGEHMHQFKDFTKDLSPFQRGEAFASWEYVKAIHNSFAKKMDMLENDKYLAYKVKKAERMKAEGAHKSKSKTSRRDSKDSNATDDSAESFEENAHHYIAFVPVNGQVWKLDGMDAQPTCMATYDTDNSENWPLAISDRIMALMAAGDDDYGCFAIAESPIVGLRKQICQTDNTIKSVHRRLDIINTDWKSFVPEDDREPPSPSWLEGISDEQRTICAVPDDIQEEIDAEEMPALLSRHAQLVSEMRRLAVEYQMEEGAIEDENESAQARRWDYGPVIKTWLEMLAENGWLEENLHLFPKN